jgi:hypothetical protein
VCGAAVEALAVASQQDRALAAFIDSEIDRATCSWYERDHCWLVALADDPQRSMAAIEADVFDVGLARFAHA